MAFTTKQKLFIAAYPAKRNGRQAAIAAGVPEDSAHTQASKWLNNPSIRAAVEEKIGDVVDRYQVSSERVIREMAKLAFGNIDDFIAKQDDGSVIIDFSTATREQIASLTQITIDEYTEGRGENARGVKSMKLRMADKQKALMDLAKIMRMLPAERHEVSGPNGGPIQQQAIGQPIDVNQLEPEQREQLRAVLFAAKRLKPSVTDVDDENEDVS